LRKKSAITYTTTKERATVINFALKLKAAQASFKTKQKRTDETIMGNMVFSSRNA
jgi:hypothetical protein